MPSKHAKQPAQRRAFGALLPLVEHDGVGLFQALTDALFCSPIHRKICECLLPLSCGGTSLSCWIWPVKSILGLNRSLQQGAVQRWVP